MRIFVCIKQVPDTETKITPNSDGTFIETNSVKWVMNPYDEFAVEQALLVKTANAGSTVTVLRVGSVKDTEALRTALAMGADDAILVDTDEMLDPYMTAKAINGAIEKAGDLPDIIFTGKQAIDDDSIQVPQILAQMLEIPSVSVVVNFEQNGSELTLKRETEGGTTEVYTVNTPAVIACQKGLNTPRYASLPGIMKAKRKPLAKHSLADVGVTEADRRIKLTEYKLPEEKPPGKKFDAMEEADHNKVVTDVVSLLRNEAKVI